GREKKWPEKRAVNAITKCEFCAAQAVEEILREGGDAKKSRLEDVGPIVSGIARSNRRCWCGGHADLSPVEAADAPGAIDWPTATLLGAPVKPPAAPMPSISSQRGQGKEAAPWRARSITRRAIFSTTCSK